MNRCSIVSTKVAADREKVGSVLARYDLEGVEFRFDEAGRLEVVGVEEEDVAGSWPQALPLAALPDRGDYDDEDEYRVERDYLYDQDGSKGFVALLRDLAGCLEAPMTVLLVSHNWDSSWSDSTVWRLEPGSTVEELSVAVYGGEPGETVDG